MLARLLFSNVSAALAACSSRSLVCFSSSSTRCCGDSRAGAALGAGAAFSGWASTPGGGCWPYWTCPSASVHLNMAALAGAPAISMARSGKTVVMRIVSPLFATCFDFLTCINSQRQVRPAQIAEKSLLRVPAPDFISGTGFPLPTVAILVSSNSALCACARYTGFFSGFWPALGEQTGGADWR